MALNHGFTYRWQIGPDGRGQTLLAHLAAAFTHSTREEWAARLAAGELTLGGALAHGREPLRPGQSVTWTRPPWHEPDVPLTFDLIHEDADLIVVAKPSGLPTMPAGGFLEHTLMTLVRARFGDAFPAHRLGRGTSGLVLFARSQPVAAALGASWRSDAVTKHYRALVAGAPEWTSKAITTPIGPVAHPRLGSIHAASPAGRPASTVATVLERRADDTLCDVDITTGRPHQIRIHMAAAGFPLVGDPLYGVGGQARADALPGDGGYLLHAHVLEVPHPSRGGPVRFEAPPPAALQTSVEQAG